MIERVSRSRAFDVGHAIRDFTARYRGAFVRISRLLCLFVSVALCVAAFGAGAGQAGAATSAIQATQSQTFAGYESTGVALSGVAATWVQPTVTCTTGGIVAFAVVIDGATSGGVQQAGTGADCTSGSPQYFAFWEEDVSTPVTRWAVTVQPGDEMTASVEYEGTNGYYLTVSDVTRGWSESVSILSTPSIPNYTAAVATEALSSNGALSGSSGPTPLPQFTSVEFTDFDFANADGVVVAANSASNMVNSSGAVIATAGPLFDGNNFTVYQSNAGIAEMAFEANTTGLWDAPSTGGGNNLDLGMASGTSPSITSMAGGDFEIAFQASTGVLWTASSAGGGGQDTGQAMQAGTSPSIAGTGNGRWEVAWQDNTGALRVLGVLNIATGDSMAAGTSPAIAAQPGGGFAVAFQGSDGDLWSYSPGIGSIDLDLSIMPGTSPSIAALSTGGYEIAFQAPTGALWTVPYTGGGGGPFQLGMLAGTSPSIAASPSGGYEVAFQANTGQLWVAFSVGGGNDLGLAMMPGTSPGMTALVSGGYLIAFQGSNGSLWTTPDTGGGTDFALGMEPGTSPAIAD
jgi:hypothetical protein